jgi:hypothetical protein
VLVAVGVALALPGAVGAGAKTTKLYTVSLSGSVHTELSEVTVSPSSATPYGCTGSTTETRKFAASMRMTTKPKPVSFASYGRLQFNVVLSSRTATASTETTGGYAVDPNVYFRDPNPNRCAYTPPPKTDAKCKFASEATSKQGAPFALLPLHGKFEFYLDRNNVQIVRCDPDPLYGGLLSGETLTKIRSSAVKALGTGRSVSSSETVTTPAVAPVTGGETVTYTLKIKRVR